MKNGARYVNKFWEWDGKEQVGANKNSFPLPNPSQEGRDIKE